MPTRCLAVIVLYNTSIQASVSYRDLLEAMRFLDREDGSFSILLYDNSPEPQIATSLPAGVDYVHAARNEGVAGAYNHALRIALAKKVDWLLTLDQDTSLPSHFLVDMFAAACTYASDTQVAAIVPQVFSENRSISPHSYVFGAWPRFLPVGFEGKSLSKLFAINSCSMLRISALNSIGGYDPAFWLDSSDLVLFARLARAGLSVVVAGGIRAQQSLAHLDQAKPVSPHRLSNSLTAESAFWDSEMTPWASFMYSIVMVRSLLGMWRRGEDRALSKLVMNSIVDRIVHSKRYRMTRWRNAHASNVLHVLKL